jgi:hypothetical protein
VDDMRELTELAVSRAAVERLAHEREGRAVQLRGCPDVPERSEQAVDAVFADRLGEYAVEHTRLVSYAGQHADGAMIDAWLGPLEQELVGRFRQSGRYQLIVIGGRLADRARDRQRARQALVDWILNTAASLPLNGAARLDAGPAGLRLHVVLRRWSGPDGGMLRIARPTPEDLERLRAEEVLRALGAKAPKLEAARNEQRRTVLVLESNDVALANTAVNRAAVERAVSLYDGPLPDTIVLVETDATPWRVEVLPTR